MGAEFDLNRLRADLVAYLRRKDRGGEEAEDVAQEAFARFHRSGHDVTAADARPLLFVIAKHIQLDRWKAAGREARRNALEDVYDLDSGPHALASPAPRADQQLIDRQNLALRSCVPVTRPSAPCRPRPATPSCCTGSKA